MARKTNTEKPSAAKIVTAAFLGLDYEVVIVAGKRYVIYPPTIKKLAGAAYYFDTTAQEETIAGVIASQENLHDVAKALSWLIQGDDKLAPQLEEGTLPEIVTALKAAYSLIDVQNFYTLSTLAKNVAKMAANPRP